ncbi:hypothetical protein MBLNU230_g5797t1 [Neophaeotheca triangularis]
MAPRRRPSASPSHHKGRFEPSEPLHMTTRNRAARDSTSTTVPSTNGSTDGSMNGDDALPAPNDHKRPSTSHSLDSRPAKVPRLSDESQKFTPPVLDDTVETEVDGDGLLHDHHRHGESTKRAQTTDTNDFAVASPPQELPTASQMNGSTIENSIEPYSEHASPVGDMDVDSPSAPMKRATYKDYGQSGDNHLTTEDQTQDFREPFEGKRREETSDLLDVVGSNVVALVPPEDLTPTQRSSTSGESPQRQQQVDVALGATYDDATPMQSAPGSPDTSVVSEEDEDEAAQPMKSAPALTHKAGPLTEGDFVGEDLDIDAADEEGRPLQKKGLKGGRRRAQNPDPVVEAAMRRQLELKIAFRNITRSLKPVLTELATRTLDNLDSDAEHHQKVQEHDSVMRCLDQVREQRLALIKKQGAAERANLERIRESYSEVARTGTDTMIDNMKDAAMDLLQHKVLQIMRAANLDEGGSYDTEDEDDVVPQPKGMAYKFNRRAPPGPLYESRSRAGLETRKAFNEMDRRLQMAQLLKDAGEYEPLERATETFTTMDNTYRDFANEMRNSRQATNTFSKAANEFERVTSIPVLPNHEASGLWALGDLASRPSIQQAGADAQYLHDMKKQQAQQTRRASMASSQAPPGPPKNYDVAPMDFSRMSGQPLPGSSTTMPPPSTPRQGSIEFLVGSPHMARREPPRSPAIPSPRMTNFLASMPRPADASSQATRSRASSLTSQNQAAQQARQTALPELQATENDRGDDRGYPFTGGLNFRGSGPPPRVPQSLPSPEGPFSSRLAEEATRAQRELMQEERSSDVTRDPSGIPSLQSQRTDSHEAKQQERVVASAASDAETKRRQGHKQLGLNTEEPKPEPEQPRSRASSMAQSVIGANQSDSSKGGDDPARRPSGKLSNDKPNLKTSKESRDGLSRREHKLKHGFGPKHHRKSTGSRSSLRRASDTQPPEDREQSQTMQAHRPIQAHQPEPQHPGYSQPPHQHPDYRHIPPGYGHPGYADPMGHHPANPYGPYPYPSYGFDPSHHRNSYPPPMHPGGPHYGYPSPLYAMPHPGSGAPPHDAFPPPPYYGPPPGTPGPMPPSSGSMPGNYGQTHQYGGPAIAPATQNSRFGSMGGYGGQGPLAPHGGHGPAFAQQARNSMGHSRDGSNGGTEGRGRSARSASDAGGFKQWFGPDGSGGRR